jgi:hypothetical protein
MLGPPDARQLLAIWYVFLDGQQRWLFGNGPVSGDHATASLSVTHGGQFPPNFDPAAVDVIPWGTLTFRAVDANNAHIDWSSALPGFGSGGMDLVRITNQLGRE